jgi:hypothetical protein
VGKKRGVWWGNLKTFQGAWRSWKDKWMQKNIGWEEADPINLPEDRNRLLDVVNAVMNNRVSSSEENFSASCVTIRFTRTAVLCRVTSLAQIVLD